MDTPKTIQALADAKITEAECLYANGHYDTSYYLAGYAIELYLKSRICTLLNIPDFFDFDNRKKFENEDNITKPYKVHNYIQLLTLSGLLHEHFKMMNDSVYKDDWTVLERWKESQRYNTGKNPQDVMNFINSAKNYITWIKQFS